MSVAEMARVIGQHMNLVVDVSQGVGWFVPVVVEDVRQVWGEVQYLVAPSDGKTRQAGQAVWVKSHRVTEVTA